MNVYKFVGSDLQLENKKSGKFIKVVLVMAADEEEARRILKKSLNYPCLEMQTFNVISVKNAMMGSVVDMYVINL